jgi:hypothetical protein
MAKQQYNFKLCDEAVEALRVLTWFLGKGNQTRAVEKALIVVARDYADDISTYRDHLQAMEDTDPDMFPNPLKE